MLALKRYEIAVDVAQGPDGSMWRVPILGPVHVTVFRVPLPAGWLVDWLLGRIEKRFGQG